ncbi:DUF397 domain-containing protein [Streptomyces sp. NPDC046805]|uniref:DUF397 domain-containing protein n=1 Tax=Streptomyces sp. NPDC046805 TaxID=3155134 RepID=UPI00340D303C
MSNPSSRGAHGLVWVTSSYSNGAGGECVECAMGDDGTLIRDSKRPEGAVVAVNGNAWHSFIQALKGQLEASCTA